MFIVICIRVIRQSSLIGSDFIVNIIGSNNTVLKKDIININYCDNEH